MNGGLHYESPEIVFQIAKYGYKEEWGLLPEARRIILVVKTISPVKLVIKIPSRPGFEICKSQNPSSSSSCGRLHYRKVSDNTTTFTSVETDVTSIQLQELSPNTQYSLYITAVVLNNGSRVESTPSETLIAWTDPAFPAFVEVMIIKLFLGC